MKGSVMPEMKETASAPEIVASVDALFKPVRQGRWATWPAGRLSSRQPAKDRLQLFHDDEGGEVEIASFRSAALAQGFVAEIALEIIAMTIEIRSRHGDSLPASCKDAGSGGTPGFIEDLLQGYLSALPPEKSLLEVAMPISRAMDAAVDEWLRQQRANSDDPAPGAAKP
jgi:hypothetical protein